MNRPERFGETDFPYVGDVAHHRSWLTDSGIPPQLRPSGVALSSGQVRELHLFAAVPSLLVSKSNRKWSSSS